METSFGPHFSRGNSAASSPAELPRSSIRGGSSPGAAAPFPRSSAPRAFPSDGKNAKLPSLLLFLFEFFEGAGEIGIARHPSPGLNERSRASFSKIRVAKSLGKGAKARRLCLLPKSLSNQLMLLRNINDKESAFIGCCLPVLQRTRSISSGHFGLRFVHLHPINAPAKKKKNRKRQISLEIPTLPSLNT